ncbi:MAG: acyl carrier protein [Flavobacteriales bacterium]|nr:acyl carrier protein [Flavobacteriales bacterium]MBK6754740.1 acyl carrier protein [Flavobacteriales bacterium]
MEKAMSSNEQELAEELCAYLRSHVLAKQVSIDPDLPFAQLGIDSMSIIELVMYLERKHGVALPDKALHPENLRTAKSLARCAIQARADAVLPSR